MDIFDIHGQVLQGPFSARGSEANKIPLERFRPDLSTIEKLVLFHQAVNLLVVDDPTQVLQFAAHVAIAIATELLVQDFFNVSHYGPIFKELTFIVYTVRAGLHSLRLA